MYDAGRMDTLDLTPKPVHKDFRISDQVLKDARQWGLHNTIGERRLDINCAVCGQSVFCTWNGAGSYRLTLSDLEGSLLAHLMQVHGWTREMSAL
jgi:hypothetical protein